MSTFTKKTLLRNRIATIAMLVFSLAPFGIGHAQEDPPSRVARLNYFEGPVSFQPAGSNTWAYATLNNPVTTGDQVWVDKDGRSELHVGSTALRLGSQTSMTVSTLDDSTVQLSLNQGTLSLRVRNLAPGEVMEVDTPNLAFTVQSPGEYRLNVDASGRTTAIVVRSGNGFAQGDGGTGTPVGTQQRIVFSGTALQQVSADVAPSYDAFDNWLVQRDRREDQSVSARYVSRDMVGYEELDNYGTWNADPNYGHVWIPTNPGNGWAPYNAGHWAWVAPWGWTWVDDQPWGFAPAHYGRWAYLRSRWCWVPGPVVARPVYAPALVAFVSGGNGRSNWSISLSSGSPGVAWFPLGPGEAYRPAYRVSPAYVNNLNRTVIINKTVNVTNINNNYVYKTVYVNQGVPNAITAVPATSFVRGQRTAGIAQRVNAQQFAHAEVMPSSPSIAPVRESTRGNPRGDGRQAPAFVPPAAIANRPLVATRAPRQPAAMHDALAARFNTPEGTVQGAGKPIAQTANQPAPSEATPRVRIVGQGAPNGERPERRDNYNDNNNGPANGFGFAGRPAAPQATSQPQTQPQSVRPYSPTTANPAIATTPASPVNAPNPVRVEPNRFNPPAQAVPQPPAQAADNFNRRANAPSMRERRNDAETSADIRRDNPRDADRNMPRSTPRNPPRNIEREIPPDTRSQVPRAPAVMTSPQSPASPTTPIAPSAAPTGAPAIIRNRQEWQPAQNPVRTEVPRPSAEQQNRPQFSRPTSAPREDNERFQRPPARPQARPEMPAPVQQPAVRPPEQAVPVVNPQNPQLRRPEVEPRQEPRAKPEVIRREEEQKQ